MAVIINTQPRLITGLLVGKERPRWLPGKNPLDLKYWNKAKDHPTMSRLVGIGYLKVDLHGSMPDPFSPPSAEQLKKFSEADLRKALEDREIPVQWHPVLEKELNARVQARLPKMVVNDGSDT